MTYTILLRRLGVACALLCLLAAQAAAGQAFKWWESDHFRREMGLTQEQSRLLEEIFQGALPALRGQKRALDEAEAQFERLVDRGEEEAVVLQVTRVEAIRAELNTTRTLMLVRMRFALTREQWAKFTALHDASERASERDRIEAHEAAAATERGR